MITDEQREKMHQVRIRQAIRELAELEQKQFGLINGNFTAKAKKHGLKAKELRHYWDKAKRLDLV